ncbi:uncharacterized protein LAESUDRAFT_651143 [Laetiporus sulphureus 93-53]|uniref:Uncharacterized protein n=1 Tax=Laetiporus sulphureus 93-53 TaxID=1314785 RepID=A0A165EQ76_9APHY|nr:uncharacterized protein LAESUDRAFT_651143 [Laetiporus sulphureus 93-53]KZT07537.1 hypothetical protein LAESUDRAFT_651143 [Laetiporus sulphureus 93-53]
MNHHVHGAYNPRTPPPNAAVAAQHAAVPTVVELERHYYELGEQRRRLEEMLEKTDRMMAGVKRGMEEMRAGQKHGQASPHPPSPAPQGQQQQQEKKPQQSSSQAVAVPLGRSGNTSSKDSVWPVAPPETSKRD